MPTRRIVLHATLWFAVFAGWLVATRPYHPTWAIAIGATAVLVSTSALAAYANQVFLVPRLAARPQRWRYVAAVLATVVALDLITVVLIQLIYAWLWHPDPLRFGFWFNMASDAGFIGVHVVAMMLLARTIQRVRRYASLKTSP